RSLLCDGNSRLGRPNMLFSLPRNFGTRRHELYKPREASTNPAGRCLAELQTVDLARLAHPAQFVLAERHQATALADRRSEVGRDEHLAAQRFAQGLDAGSFVDRRADHSEVEPIDGADIAIEHLTEM